MDKYNLLHFLGHEQATEEQFRVTWAVFYGVAPTKGELQEFKDTVDFADEKSHESYDYDKIGY